MVESKRKKHTAGIVIFAGICILLFSLSGCTKEHSLKNDHVNTLVPSTADDDKKIVIGFSIATDTFIIERWNKDIKIFTEAARNLGAEVIMQFSAGGAKAQIDQIEYMMKKDIDVLVVLAHDTDMLAGAVSYTHLTLPTN